METNATANLIDEIRGRAPIFAGWLESLAAKHGKTVEQIHGWWKEYADYCRVGDQCPVEFEFEQWYADKLAA